MTQTSQTTTTTSGPGAVQKKEDGKSQGGGGAALRSHVRGMSFDQGAAALAPIQKKDDKSGGAHDTGGDKTEATKLAPGDGKNEGFKGLVSLGEIGNIGNMFEKVADVALGFMVGPGSAIKFAVEALATYNFIGLKLSSEIELSQSPEGKWETQFKLGVGIGAFVDVDIDELLKVEFSAAYCRDYACKAGGDSPSEVFRLCRLGVERSMRVAAGQIQPPDKEQASLKKKSWWEWLCEKTGQAYNYVTSLPAKGLVAMLWGYDVDNYQGRENAALEELDGDDFVETTSTHALELGGKLEVGGENGTGVGATGKMGAGEKTTLKKGSDGKLGGETEQGQAFKFGMDYKFGEALAAKWEIEGFGEEGEMVIEGKGHLLEFAKDATVIMGGLKSIAGVVAKLKPGKKADTVKNIANSKFTGMAATISTVVMNKIGGEHGGGEHGGEHGGGEHGGMKKEGGIEFKLELKPEGLSLKAIEVLYELEAEGGHITGGTGVKGKMSAVGKTSLYHAHDESHDEGGTKH